MHYAARHDRERAMRKARYSGRYAALLREAPDRGDQLAAIVGDEPGIEPASGRRSGAAVDHHAHGAVLDEKPRGAISGRRHGADTEERKAKRVRRRYTHTQVIDLIITQRRRDLGGFEVGRLLPYAKRRMIGPFIFFDHMGPMDFAPGISRSVDVRPHPHIGLSTLTYLFAGEVMHRDSIGSEQPIRPGEVNWMTAGRGITHSERFERARRDGGPMNGIQAWVALPKDKEEADPAFSHHAATELPLFEEGGVRTRLIAGEAFGAKAPVAVYSPLFYLHCELSAGARGELRAQYPERAAYVVSGSIELNAQRFEAGQMLVFRPGASVAFSAPSDATIMLLGGEPLGHRFIEWNFVSSSRERIEQAKADWRAGRMKLPDLDHDEFIPLPPEPMTPANPMS